MLLLKLLVLLIVANGTPILIRRIMGSRLNFPVDAHKNWIDQRPLLGSSKTWRGLISSIAVTTVAGLLLSFHWSIGFIIAAGAMAGDLLSSFIKRRIGIATHDMAIVIDQVPESLVPLLLVAGTLSLTGMEILVLTFAFFIIELLLSKILYRLHIRNRPY